MDLRAETRRLNERITELTAENEGLRDEIVRLQGVNEAHLVRIQELHGVPADCVLISLSESDVQVLAEHQGSQNG